MPDSIDENRDYTLRVHLEVDDGDSAGIFIQCFAPEIDDRSQAKYVWRPCEEPLPLTRDPVENSLWRINRNVVADTLEEIGDISFPFKFVCVLFGDSDEKVRAKYYSRLISQNYTVTGVGHSSSQLALGLEAVTPAKHVNDDHWYIWFLQVTENLHIDVRNLSEINHCLTRLSLGESLFYYIFW